MNYASTRQQIVDEITFLKDELKARRSAQVAGLRPVPACVVGAYQRLLTAQYERLDQIDDPTNDPR